MERPDQRPVSSPGRQLTAASRRAVSLRNLAEVALSRLLRSVLARPRRWLLGTLLVGLILGSALPRLELRTDGAAIHPTGDATVERSAHDREVFNDPQQVILLVTARDGGPTVESTEGLLELKEAHDALSRLPSAADFRVRSLASLLDPPSNLRSLALRTYLDRIPRDPVRLAYLGRRLHEHPLTDGLFLSADGRAAALYVPLAEGHGRAELVAQLQDWVTERRGSAFELRLTGPLIAEALLGEKILRDLGRLVPWMVAVIAVLLALALRTPGGVLVSLLEILWVLMSTLGAMAWCGVPITLVTTILPILVMTIAVTDEIHLLERFESHLSSQEPDSARCPDRRRRAMAAALADVGRPIVLTSLTTSVGFLSFLSASMAPVRHLGLFTAIGILLAMVLSFTLVPALAVLLPGSWFESPRRFRPARTLTPFEKLVVRRSRPGLLFGSLLLLISLPGVFRLRVQDSWIDNFNPDSPVVSAERDFNASFWGSYRFDLVLSSGVDGFFHQPPGIRLLEEVSEVALSGPHVGGIVTPLTFFQLIAPTLDLEGPLSSLDADELLDIARFGNLLRARLDLDHYISPGAEEVRLRLFVKSADYRRARALESYLAEKVPPLLQGHGVDYHASGDLPVALAVVRSIVTNQLRSIVWTLAGVGLLLAVACRSLRRAVVQMVPLLATLGIMLGALGHAGVTLGIATSMFTALTIGVGIDFALHFSHAYRRRRSAGRSHADALARVLASAGRALRWNMGVLALGFLVLTLSALRPNHSLGFLLAGAMVTSYLTTLLFLPGLLRWEAERAGSRESAR